MSRDLHLSGPAADEARALTRTVLGLSFAIVLGAAACRSDPVAVPEDPIMSEAPRPDFIPAPDSLLVCDPTARMTPFTWGINGHPVAPAPAYDFRDDPERLRRQMRLIKDLGFSHYRVDVHFEIDGTEPGLLAQVAPVAEEFGITLLPAITFHPSLVPQTPQEARRVGQTIGAAFVRRYGARFPVVELGNELDIPAMRGHMVGHVVEHYRVEDLKRFTALLRGMLGKLRAGAPTVRTIINTSMSHTGFLQYLLDHEVPFDIVGWHLYADELGYGTDVEHGGDYPSALKRLEALGRDIWITESNRHQGSGPGNAFGAQQEVILRRLAAEMYAHPLVKAFFVYELYDEVSEPGDEAYYGLVHCAGPVEVEGNCLGALELKPAYLSALAWRGVRASAAPTP